MLLIKYASVDVAGRFDCHILQRRLYAYKFAVKNDKTHNWRGFEVRAKGERRFIFGAPFLF